MAGAKRSIDIGQIGPRQGGAADQPGDREYGSDEIGRAGRAVLQRLQNLPNGLLIVISRAKGAGIAAAAADVVVGGERGWYRGHFAPVIRQIAGRIGDGFGLERRVAVVVVNLERFLDRRQRRFRRIHYLFWVVGHIGRRLAIDAGLYGVSPPWRLALTASRARYRSNPADTGLPRPQIVLHVRHPIGLADRKKPRLVTTL